KLPGFGSNYKRQVKALYPAYARVWMSGGEMLARKENAMTLDPHVRDAWGIPVARIACTHSDNDRAIYNDFFERAKELLHSAGGEMIASQPHMGVPGSLIHEVGSSRMGNDKKASVLNSFCQAHDMPNLFVFGGGCFVTTGDKHPTLTMMALTARGCDYLTGLVRKGELT
ncbi:MAG: GMC family oxidoreductase, partial [Acidobacteriaceae bacterium]|nr:GMC family oxidoreductase [Acidobacteriaceae bacterium]